MKRQQSRKEAEADLIDGFTFRNVKGPDLVGISWIRCFSDIDSLLLYAGTTTSFMENSPKYVKEDARSLRFLYPVAADEEKIGGDKNQ